MYAVVAVLSHLTHSPLVAEKVYPQLSEWCISERKHRN